MQTRSFPRIVAVASLLLSHAFAGEGWLVDFEKAKLTAKTESKDILMDFTGSDWCGWCIKLRDEVFTKTEFKSAAPQKFVLLELDFPQSPEVKGKMKPETIEQNARLNEKFEVQGYPTILLVDAEGRPYAKTGYQAGGPAGYVKHLDDLRQIRLTRDDHMAKAKAASGVEKAKALAAAIADIDEEIVAKHYATELSQIRELDPSDTTGTNKKFGFKPRLNQIREKLGQNRIKGYEALRSEADTAAADPSLSKDQKQQILFEVLGFLRPPKDNQNALKLLEDIKAIDPNTEIGKRADSIIPRVKQMIEKAAANEAPSK